MVNSDCFPLCSQWLSSAPEEKVRWDSSVAAAGQRPLLPGVATAGGQLGVEPDSRGETSLTQGCVVKSESSVLRPPLSVSTENTDPLSSSLLCQIS